MVSILPHPNCWIYHSSKEWLRSSPKKRLPAQDATGIDELPAMVSSRSGRVRRRTQKQKERDLEESKRPLPPKYKRGVSVETVYGTARYQRTEKDGSRTCYWESDPERPYTLPRESVWLPDEKLERWDEEGHLLVDKDGQPNRFKTGDTVETTFGSAVYQRHLPKRQGSAPMER